MVTPSDNAPETITRDQVLRGELINPTPPKPATPAATPVNPPTDNPFGELEQWMKVLEYGAGYLDRFMDRFGELAKIVKGAEARISQAPAQAGAAPRIAPQGDKVEMETTEQVTPEDAAQRERDKYVKAEGLFDEFQSLARMGAASKPGMTVEELLIQLAQYKGPIVSAIAKKL